MTTASPDTPSLSPQVVTDTRACIKCGYSLQGLATSGVCPECGTPVADSLRGTLLQFSAPEFIATIRQGHVWVLNGILASIIVGVATVVIALATSGSAAMMTLMQFVNLGIAVFIFLGYLKLTEPDPQFQGTEKPDSARNIVRIAVIAQIVISVLQIVLNFAVPASAAGPSGLAAALTLVLTLAGFAGLAVQFFAMMLYTRWLAARIPDEHIVKRTKTYMWLLPLLATVGMIVVGLGGLIALVLYWNMLHRMRQHLVSIEKTGAPANLLKVKL